MSFVLGLMNEIPKTLLAAPNGALFGLAYGTAIRIGYEQLYPFLFPKDKPTANPTDIINSFRQLFTITGGLGAFDFGIDMGLQKAFAEVNSQLNTPEVKQQVDKYNEWAKTAFINTPTTQTPFGPIGLPNATPGQTPGHTPTPTPGNATPGNATPGNATPGNATPTPKTELESWIEIAGAMNMELSLAKGTLNQARTALANANSMPHNNSSQGMAKSAAIESASRAIQAAEQNVDNLTDKFRNFLQLARNNPIYKSTAEKYLFHL